MFFGVAILNLILSIRSFNEKGFLLNNAYLYASKQERERMNKRPYYRQSAVTFMLLGIVFALIGFDIIFNVDWLYYIAIIIILIAVIYAILSSISIEKRKNNR
ncbi:MAG: DUF3784 domain-containing protein [Oscillospiraceae bacterium]|nr:DUF3784 domain-containing protein [Oscillospiraceae bacterium]